MLDKSWSRQEMTYWTAADMLTQLVVDFCLHQSADDPELEEAKLMNMLT
jgi:hypothetical protein